VKSEQDGAWAVKRINRWQPALPSSKLERRAAKRASAEAARAAWAAAASASHQYLLLQSQFRWVRMRVGGMRDPRAMQAIGAMAPADLAAREFMPISSLSVFAHTDARRTDVVELVSAGQVVPGADTAAAAGGGVMDPAGLMTFDLGARRRVMSFAWATAALRGETGRSERSAWADPVEYCFEASTDGADWVELHRNFNCHAAERCGWKAWAETPARRAAAVGAQQARVVLDVAAAVAARAAQVATDAAAAAAARAGAVLQGINCELARSAAQRAAQAGARAVEKYCCRLFAPALILLAERNRETKQRALARLVELHHERFASETLFRCCALSVEYWREMQVPW
jgi:hypothetical protein